ncbi:MAG: hypothetical protein NTU62_11600 [Spirochaetes bacterium]|nr:hypothetical protein [Spirochaetota bacterium]
MKKLLVVLVLIGVAAGAFAQDWAASYNKPGNINLYASGGWYYWPEVSVAAEYMIGEFNIGPVPLDWGVAVRGGMDFWSGGIDYSVGALATLHLGLIWNLEFYASLGACFYGPTAAFPVTVASYEGLTYWFSKSLGVVLESGYLGWYFWGVGIEFKL